jgi:hypothetical protein
MEAAADARKGTPLWWVKGSQALIRAGHDLGPLLSGANSFKEFPRPWIVLFLAPGHQPWGTPAVTAV